MPRGRSLGQAQGALLLLEGSDCSGKTTLAAELARRLDGFSAHHGVYKQNPFNLYLRDYLHVLRGVVDRGHLSEHVYGTCVREVDRIGPSYRMLERVLINRAAVVCLCRPSWPTVLANWYASPKAVGKPFGDEQLRKVYDAFAAIDRGHAVTVSYDYTRHTVDDVLWQVELYRELYPPNPGPGLGAWRPDRSALLLGDRSNGDKDLPFVSLTGCSPWLAAQLEEANVSEQSLYWANVETVDGHELDPLFLDALRPPLVVTLGLRAAAWCQRHCVGAHEMTHPQYHKRFHHRKPYPLIDLLRDLRHD